MMFCQAEKVNPIPHSVGTGKSGVNIQDVTTNQQVTLDDDFMSGIAARSTLPEFAVPRCPTVLSIKYHRLIGYQVDIGCPSNGHQHRQRHKVNLDQALAAFICTQTEGD